MSHTPGPWSVSGADNRIVRNFKGGTVATVKDEKNAPLISAAPELLAALREVMVVAMELEPMKNDERFQNALLVIAKAEGCS